MIFTPKWVGTRVFDKKAQIKAAVPFMPADPIKYESSDISLTVSDTELSFTLHKFDIGSMSQAERLAVKVLGELDDTPIQSIVVAFALENIVLSRENSAVFDSYDRARFGKLNWKLDGDSIARHLIRGTNRLTIFMTRAEPTIRAAFLYTFDVEESNSAVKAIAGKVVSMWEDAVEILRRVYQVEVGRGDD